MTSLEPGESNRLNAAKSTGPRTQAGKAAAALNSLRHGLLARELLVKGENEEDFTVFAGGVRTRLSPIGELEIFVVNRIISAAWRLRRAVAVEAALFRTKRGSITAIPADLGKMQLLSRYEVTLERSLYRALEQLHGLQGRREQHEWRHPEEFDSEISGLDAEETAELGSFGKNTESGACAD